MKKSISKKKVTRKGNLKKSKPTDKFLSSKTKKILLAVGLTVIVFGSGLFSLQNNNQLGLMGGMTEEYLQLGVNMYYTGNFYLSENAETPFVFRPPGYVKYLSMVLKNSGKMKPKDYQYRSQEEFIKIKNTILNAIYRSQCLLVALSSLILFLLLADILSSFLAFVIALTFGINPYLIMLTGIVHYETLHIFMLLLSTWLTYLAFKKFKFRLGILFLAGLFWGLTTLVRPVSLIMPALFSIALFLYFKKDWKRSLTYFVVFVVSFVGAIAPYTYRNYKLMNQFIPVNAQSNIAFWAGSKQSLSLDANHYRWWEIWNEDAQKEYEKITGDREYKTAVYADHITELEKFYKGEFKRNFSAQPMVYIGNVFKNFLLVNFGINSVYIKMFQFKQINNAEIDKNWLKTGNAQTFYPGTAENAFKFLIYIMSILSIIGMFLAIKNRDYLIYIPLMAFLTIAISHSITYMDFMYYYIRIPFLFIFTAYFIKHIGSLFTKQNPLYLQKIVATGLFVCMLLLFVTIIF